MPSCRGVSPGCSREELATYVEPHNDVFLLQIFTIKELVEVDRWVVHIQAVVWMARSRFGILLLGNVEVMCEWVDSINEIAGVL
jgi:hypothetical protein